MAMLQYSGKVYQPPHPCCKIWVLVKHWVVESRLYSHMIRFESRYWMWTSEVGNM